MSSIKLPHSRFLHFPKTAGWWVAHAIHEAGIQSEINVRITDGGHVGHVFGDLRSVPSFGFIRNPESWYPSLFNYLDSTKWFCHENAKSENVDEFISKVINRETSIMPMTDWVINFFGVGKEVSYIGKYENLCEDLITALKIMDEDFDQDVIRRVSEDRINVSMNKAPRLLPQTIRMIRKHDSYIYERFEYDDS